MGDRGVEFARVGPAKISLNVRLGWLSRRILLN